MTSSSINNNTGSGAESTVENRQGIDLYGDSPQARRASAKILVSVARRRGESPDPWVAEVAAGRIPA